MKTYTGGCHCGAVRYEAQLDLEKPAISCNCSHCQMKGWLLSFIPAEQFKLLKGEDNLTEYRFNTEKIAHLFCKTCGVQSFGRGKGHDGVTEMIAINLNCIDDLDPATLETTMFDGKSV